MAELVDGAYAIISCGSSFAALTANNDGFSVSSNAISSRAALSNDNRFYVISKTDSQDNASLEHYLYSPKTTTFLSNSTESNTGVLTNDLSSVHAVFRSKVLFDNVQCDAYTIFIQDSDEYCFTNTNGSITVETYDGRNEQLWAFVPIPIFDEAGFYQISGFHQNDERLFTPGISLSFSNNVLSTDKTDVPISVCRLAAQTNSRFGIITSYWLTTQTNLSFGMPSVMTYLPIGLDLTSSAKTANSIPLCCLNEGDSPVGFDVSITGIIKNGEDGLNGSFYRPTFEFSCVVDNKTYSLCIDDNGFYYPFYVYKADSIPKTTSDAICVELSESWNMAIPMFPEIEEKYFLTEPDAETFSQVDGVTILTRTGSGKCQYRYRYAVIKSEDEVPVYSKWYPGSRMGWPIAGKNSTISRQKTTDPFVLPINIDPVPVLDNIAMIYEIETRGFASSSLTSYIGHTTISRIKNVRIPNVDISSFDFFFDTESNSVGFSITVEPSYSGAISLMKVDVYNERSELIGNTSFSDSETFRYILGNNLTSFPENNSVLTFSIQAIFSNVIPVRTYSVTKTITYTDRVLDVETTSFKNEGESIAVSVVDNPSLDYKCFYSVRDPNGSRMVVSDYVFTQNGKRYFVCYPPLNQDTLITVIGKNSNDDYYFGIINHRIDSHLFVWNWVEDFDERSASIIVNVDSPPAQTRSYSTSTSIAEVYSRTYPLAFANENIHVTLDIEGIVLDGDYILGGLVNPIPINNNVEALVSMVSLSHKGIHPIFRNPYGDWFKVVVTSIDVSKNDIMYTTVNVKQEAVDA